MWAMTMPESRVSQPISTAEAERIAREVFGLNGTATALPGEYDDNFHLRSSGGGEFVLKIMHPSRERELVELQCEALRHLADHAPSLVLPQIRATRKGKLFTTAEVQDGASRLVWTLSYVRGKVMADVKPHSAELLRELGRLLGDMNHALASFEHPAAKRELKWDSARAGWIGECLDYVADPARRKIVEDLLDLYRREVIPAMPELRRSVIYGDANDYNVIVTQIWPAPRVSVIDFGDMHEGITVSEAAIAAAYAILGKNEPLTAAAEIVSGYHAANPLTEKEIEVLFPLIGMRLAVSVVNSAHRKTVKDDPYVTISEAPAWNALEKLAKISPRFAQYVFRNACGFEPVAKGARVAEFLKKSSTHAASPLDADIRSVPCKVFDLSVDSRFLGANPKGAEATVLNEAIFRELKNSAAVFGVGRYDEARGIYNAPQFAGGMNRTDERRTIHLGIDLFAESGAAIHAPLEGEVYLVARNDAPLDYGPLVILKHTTDGGEDFFTLYGHLAAESTKQLRRGQAMAKGEVFARNGEMEENGGWPPHLHFQIIVDLLELEADFPGVARPSQRAIWTSLSPDPNLLLGIPAEHFPEREGGVDESLADRRRLLGGNLSVSYAKPLKIVRGWMQYLYDDTGRAYLDVYNNVPLVGHSHPRVVRAVQEQIALLNTNTRYLHDNAIRYAQRLVDKLPDPLRVCYFVNSGSEANELALRLARAHTGQEGVVVLEHAYHGNTTTLIDVSPYKFNGPGGRGQKPWVHVAPLADVYRGRYRESDPEAGTKYAEQVAEILKRSDGGQECPPHTIPPHTIGAFLAETLPSVGGQIVFPPNYLAEVYKHVRAAGAVCIADEVQVGFGRLGTHFWGFETQNAVPDIVVLGKPIGNAFPLAAVVTTKAIARSFDNGMEFFSTFGGNPVACAAGLAVLDVLEDEKLQENAERMGSYLKSRLQELQKRHTAIGDVRGLGLFLGVDLVRDRETREAATEQAAYVVNRLRERGMLTGTDGPYHNVIKLRPPLVFSKQDADLFLEALDEVLGEDAAQAG